MKNITFLTILIFIGNISLGQNWHPFVLNHNAYFLQENNGNKSIDNFNCDSMHTSINYDAFYFNTKSEIPINCYSNLLFELPNYTFNKPDSVLCYDDSIVIFSNIYSQTQTFILKQNANLGEQWNTDGTSIKCSDLGIESVLGQQDSVKTFICYTPGNDSVEIVLSKKYGLLRFKPFFSMFNPYEQYYELIGLENDSINIGYKQADFSDYFHLHAGDILVWRNLNENYSMQKYEITFHRDSITYSYISADSIFYGIHRKRYGIDASLENESDVSIYYLRRKIGEMLNNNLNYWNLPNSHTFFQEELIHTQEIILTVDSILDSIQSIEFTSSGFTIDTSSCSIGVIFDYARTESFNTKAGQIYIAEHGWGEISSRLVGWIISSKLEGDTTIYTSISNKSIININVYPTCFIDFIIVDIKNIDSYHFKFFNSIGNEIKFTQVSNKLEFTELPQGIYFLKIFDEKGNFKTIKLLKN